MGTTSASAAPPPPRWQKPAHTACKHSAKVSFAVKPCRILRCWRFVLLLANQDRVVLNALEESTLGPKTLLRGLLAHVRAVPQPLKHTMYCCL